MIPAEMQPEEIPPSIAARAMAVRTEVEHVLGKAKRVLFGQLDPERRYIQLMKFVDQATAAIAPHTPCRKGCSSCCHLQTQVCESEADAIAAYTGRTARVFDRTMEQSVEAMVAGRDRWYGVPCPFLKDNACSIYEVRPLACRLHHTVADDASVCEITPANKEGLVPHIGLQVFDLAWGKLHAEHETFGDIREFFPE